MANKPYKPDYTGTITKYVFIESPDTTPQTLAIRAYELSEGVMIKETCFGLQITGKPEEVNNIIIQLRNIDPTHIFVKDRAFPPGDPRRCRANLGGARPGYFGHEFEMRLIKYISKGLLESDSKKGYNKDILSKLKKKSTDKLPAEKLQKIIETQEP
ncbi:methanogenesis marker 6 protein [Methanoplanus sp. FWC-SCC4]|uniref:Methanogenesis marker 6 protein n=1 Tax=Methanochimaera problematica TaxID=2609417 RepID=A0AA97FCI5_9EURY|nr:methanogenesis marker 6 protein [Methanoplanus sp. FWC-SCC4]WOF15709.1 methanogenesis marker 6 protein [Methanoplanus sp. FWC-SCC4]